ncbi:BTB POZ fold domain containing [Cordyceps militaris]|uniref:BTB POZ fold domain containing n=1 Tax=Cordyceps militaris TaxID=73501 RepID=A0A2H4SFK9_CORMI|nr:BTB POZ fold domain containing [Cordyceps militaris]
MFSSRRAERTTKSFSKGHKVSKSSSLFRESSGVSKRRHESSCHHRRPTTASTDGTAMSNGITSSVVTLVVGAEQRLFAAHDDVLCASPFFAQTLRASYADPAGGAKRITLPDEEPEIFSSVLEYLYKGDYFPRLAHNQRRDSWEMETQTTEEERARVETVYHRSFDGDLLKDTVIYCAAERYGLAELKKIALLGANLSLAESGIQCSTILASARYAYANTPDTDSKLRAHYLALIIRSRNTFKRSGTMQLEMHNGGTPLFFDLFVALCNHVDDVASGQNTPKSKRFGF